MTRQYNAEDVTFPVYVVEKISRDVDRYATYEVMQSFLEKADVRTSALEAYDREGFMLKLEVGKEQSSWLKVSNLGTKVSMSDLWELKFHAVAHEKQPEELAEFLKRKLRLS